MLHAGKISKTANDDMTPQKKALICALIFIVNLKFIEKSVSAHFCFYLFLVLSLRNRIRISPIKKKSAIEKAANLIPEAEGSVISIRAKILIRASYLSMNNANTNVPTMIAIFSSTS